VNREELVKIANFHGVSAMGTACVDDILDRFPLLSDTLTKGLHTGISILVRVSSGVLNEITDRPTRLYFHHYRRLNHLLDLVANIFTCKLLDEGYEAVPIPASQTIDWENQQGHISHKAIAVKAGLGWLGRNNLLVTPSWGSQVRLVSVLTDAEFEPGNTSPVEDGCGKCTACIKACPAGAIGQSFREYDREECLVKMKELCKMAGIGHYICGICVKVCRGTGHDERAG
jgi:epoxyqueuosine reductase QueG